MGCGGSKSKVSPSSNNNDIDKSAQDLIVMNSIHTLTRLSSHTYKSYNIGQPSEGNDQENLQIFEYKFLHPIGKGQISIVYLVERIDTGERFAAKIYRKNQLFNDNNNDNDDNDEMDKIIQEIHIMSTYKHPNLLSIIEVLDDDNISCLIFIMEFADKGTLLPQGSDTPKFTENEAKAIFSQVCKGIEYLHSNNIIHHDIKPQNIFLFSDGRVVLADFSHSIMLDSPNDIITTTQTTLPFCSPESLSNSAYHGKKADIWALGITLYFMIYGCLPFFDVDNNSHVASQFYKLSQQIINEPVQYDPKISISDDLKDLFQKMLEKNSDIRLDIYQVLQHPWLKQSMSSE